METQNGFPYFFLTHYQTLKTLLTSFTIIIDNFSIFAAW